MKESFEILGVITKEYPKKETLRNQIKLDKSKYFDFLKVLKENTGYHLNSNYKINYSTNLVTVEKKREPFDLFCYKKPYVQVNAIVGKNGSGKSTFSEILYLMLFNLAVSKNIIKDEYGEKITDYHGFLNAILVLKEGNEIVIIDFSILDYTRDHFFKKSDKNTISVFKKKIDDNNHAEISLNYKVKKDFDIKDLFYMISLNYSLYGLNELNIGNWIRNIFHKNDMYQTPIVINPYREYGKINVNTEGAQNNARTISNLSHRTFKDFNTNLSKDYKFYQLNIFYSRSNRKSANLTPELIELRKKESGKTSPPAYLKQEKAEHQYYSPYNYFIDSEKESPLLPASLSKILSEWPKNYPLDSESMGVMGFASLLMNNSLKNFDVIHNYFYNINSKTELNEILVNIKVNEDSRFILIDLFSYFICKLYRIGYNYPREFGKLLNSERNGFNEEIDDFEKALFEVLTSSSHACFKLKRTYFFLNFLKGEGVMKHVASNNFQVGLSFWKLNSINQKRPSVLDYKNILKNPDKRPKYSDDYFFKLDTHFFDVNELSWRLPPPIFNTECKLKNINNDKIVSLEDLSSGETQFIYTLQTAYYHLLNIDSNKEYSNAILFFDEIELYYHPEYQRIFLNTLLKQLNEIKFENIKNIQVIFLTHSPFILSDIPSSNILRLKEGAPSHPDEETFGANIHKLLANDFFLNKGYIGAFAKSQIDKVLDFINNKTDSNSLKEFEKVRSIVDLVGEPVIKHKLTQMLEDNFPSYFIKGETLDEKIERQEIVLRDLRFLKNKKENEDN